MDKIKLNDILQLTDLENVKIRFITMSGAKWSPIEIFKNTGVDKLLDDHYWNYERQKSYKEGQITVGLARIENNLWLLFHIGKVTKDLNKLNAIGYEYEILSEYKKYFGRLIVRYKNKAQTLVRLANSVIEECEVAQILPDIFDNDLFPGYDKINLSWNEMSKVIEKDSWKTALQNQKGVYLITDISNGKKYVGSAYGENMILGRWQSYVKNGHGGNVGLKVFDFDYIKTNFYYSILDIFKSTADDRTILERESWWKVVLQSREFGYNEN
ncbi:MAG: GIY-YIG nuclease family protein [Bacteroidetes bacterium]|nr:GIY-YIG nuclease family protein [Bacteroidota bacterium]